MPIRPRNHDRPITPATVAEVKKLAKLRYTAQQIAYQIGRSKISVYNIAKLYNISLGNNK